MGRAPRPDPVFDTVSLGDDRPCRLCRWPARYTIFVGEPQTNGVIERLFRTLKEQAIHGRIFRTIDDVRDAVRAFVARYNAEWLIEKNGHRSPDAMRAAWSEQTFRRAA